MNNYKTINKQKYLFNVSLHNPTTTKKVMLNPNTILTLVLEEDLHSWPVTGYLIVENPYGILDKKFKSSEANSEDLTIDPYRFRNDGNDFIDIEIRPEKDGLSESFFPQMEDRLWKIIFKGVVYDKEDIPSPNSEKKMVKLYFWDEKYHRTLKKNLVWSTATSKYNPSNFSSAKPYDPAHATDDQRKMYTGDAIRALLLENGFSPDDIATEWNKGEGSIFYTSPINAKLYDGLEYLLKYHVSSYRQGMVSQPVGDLCFLDVGRFTNKFELVSLSDVFKKAGNSLDAPGEFQLEHLFYEDVGGGPPPMQMAPQSAKEVAPIERKLKFDKDIKIAKIKSYQFSDMSGMDNLQNMVTRYIHSYYSTSKSFIINSNYSDISKYKEYAKNLYVSNVYTDGSNPVSVTLNNSKFNNEISRVDYSLYDDREQIMKRGLGELLYKGLILNQCLAFDIEGATFRTSGKFMGIDKLSLTDSYNDYKLCGQWFSTNVKHIFQNEQYINRIVAVKLHTFKDLGISDNV